MARGTIQPRTKAQLHGVRRELIVGEFEAYALFREVATAAGEVSCRTSTKSDLRGYTETGRRVSGTVPVELGGLSFGIRLLHSWRTSTMYAHNAHGSDRTPGVSEQRMRPSLALYDNDDEFVEAIIRPALIFVADYTQGQNVCHMSPRYVPATQISTFETAQTAYAGYLYLAAAACGVTPQ